MIGRLIQRLVWRVFGAYQIDPALLDAMEDAISEQGERMGLNVANEGAQAVTR